MASFPPPYGYGPGMGGAPGTRPPFLGGPGAFPPPAGMMGAPGMGGPGLIPRPGMYRSGPPPLNMPPIPGPGGFPGVPTSPSGVAPSRATTVYVGKIAASIPDPVVRELLEACGTIKSWNPVKEPSGQSKGFGFCEYEDGEGALRSLRLLNNLKVDGQELLLKPNTATQKYLVWYEQQKDARRRQKEHDKAEQEAKRKAEAEQKAADDSKQDGDADVKKEQDEEPDVDEAAQEQATDDLALAIIMGIVSGRSTPPPESADKDKDRQDERLHGPPPAELDERRRAADMNHEAARERAMEAEFERERERRRRVEEDQRRRDEREYQRRLDMWERHEREKDRDRERERDRQKDAERERARFIKADVEAKESDDETEPWQRRSLRHHRRTEERRKRRQREMFDDEADRRKEQQELAELAAKQALQQEQGSPSRSAADGIKQEPEHNQLQQAVEAESSQQVQEHKPVVDTKDEIYQAMLAAAAGSAPVSAGVSPAHQLHTQPAVVSRPAAIGTSLLGKKGRQSAVNALFGEDDDDNSKKRKLVPIKYSDEELRAVEDHSAAVAAAAAGAAAAAAASQHAGQQDDGTVPVYPAGLDVAGRKAFLRQWMDTLPNTREALHAFPVRWQFMNDSSLKNITAWVSKKVPELVGMEEPDLVDFIMANVRKQVSADSLESELEPILAQDASGFVMKLKRLIIYECERTALMGM